MYMNPIYYHPGNKQIIWIITIIPRLPFAHLCDYNSGTMQPFGFRKTTTQPFLIIGFLASFTLLQMLSSRCISLCSGCAIFISITQKIERKTYFNNSYTAFSTWITYIEMSALALFVFLLYMSYSLSSTSFLFVLKYGCRFLLPRAPYI